MRARRRHGRRGHGAVERAFGAFLRRIGPRRGFVLIGHSQGTYHLLVDANIAQADLVKVLRRQIRAYAGSR